jgi:hypothetical protein
LLVKQVVEAQSAGGRRHRQQPLPPAAAMARETHLAHPLASGGQEAQARRQRVDGIQASRTLERTCPDVIAQVLQCGSEVRERAFRLTAGLDGMSGRMKSQRVEGEYPHIR